MVTTATVKEKIDYLRTNLPEYAQRYLKIRPKDGGAPVPLVFNEAQMRLHCFIEDMVKAKQLVRVAICKGRQQGMCLAPKTPVLMESLTWKQIQHVMPGEKVIAVDENINGKYSRKMRTAVVEARREVQSVAYLIKLEDGKELVATGPHRFLVQRINNTDPVWRPVSSCKPGYKIRKITDFWGTSTFDDAWFGGILDGEGHISSPAEAGVSICASQGEGYVWQKIISFLNKEKYTFNISWDYRDHRKNKPVGRVEIGRSNELFRLLGKTRPVRFLNGRNWWEGRNLPTFRGARSWMKIVSIEKLPRQKMIDLQTSTKTFIANGFVSHNSTYTAARFLHKSTLNVGVSVFILAHMTKSTSYLFDMVKRMYANLPGPLQPAIDRSNKIELRFNNLDSEYALGTAGSKDIGRSMNPQLLHLSEAAFYDNTDELAAGLLQGVSTSLNTEIIMESTANGVGNMFYNLCMIGCDPNSMSRFKTIFLPWYIQKEYRETPPARFRPTTEEQELMELYGLDVEQVFWRRRKIEDDFKGNLGKFKQEYPFFLQEAFQSSGDVLIMPEDIERARKTHPFFDTMAPMVMGVDGAGEGTDETAWVVRQGRRVVDFKVYGEPVKPMRLAGIVAQKIDSMGLDMVFLDTAFGYGCRDRLVEMGYGPKTLDIHFGSSPLMPELYKNKRAQMYGMMKEWFEEGGCAIPEDEMFARDLRMIPGFEVSGSRGLLMLPPKEKIREKNEGHSPNIADALALTFAFPIKSRGLQSKITAASPDVVRARSPFKSRRLAQTFVKREKPSELYIKN